MPTSSPTKPKRPSSPKGLKPKGSKLWREIVGKWDLRADELRILEDACREADTIDRLEEAWEKAPLFLTGSQKQLVANPLVQELRQHRSVLRQLLGALDLPDDDSAKPATQTSSSARAAAADRWHGKAAG